MKLDREEMDEDLGLVATDLLYAEDLADRFVEHDTRELAERAPPTATGPTGTSSSTRRRSCPRWTGGC